MEGERVSERRGRKGEKGIRRNRVGMEGRGGGGL